MHWQDIGSPMVDPIHISLPFMKMHGLGNDFVVIDARSAKMALSPQLICALADRHRGVGFDQLAVMKTGDVDAHLDFFNADGSSSAACGNATRCVARYIMQETEKSELVLSTGHGRLIARDSGDGLTAVNMGPPELDWDKIPLAEPVDTLNLAIKGDPVATGMGNPHCTFFVPDAEAIDLSQSAAPIEHHPLFPQRTNVQFASLVAPNHLRMRVWERGVGVTLASGSSSCATAVAAARRGLTGRSVKIDLDGGRLWVDWRSDGVWMTGPTQHVFSGVLTEEFLTSIV